jgi:hypothetical protein
MNAKTLADFRVDHGAVLECLLVDSFTALMRFGVASLDRVAQDGVRVRFGDRGGPVRFSRCPLLRHSPVRIILIDSAHPTRIGG